MAREDGVDELRDDGVFVADDAGEERGRFLCSDAGLRGLAESGDQVFAEFVLDGAGKTGGGEFAGAEGAEGLPGEGSPCLSIDVSTGTKGSARRMAFARVKGWARDFAFYATFFTPGLCRRRRRARCR